MEQQSGDLAGSQKLSDVKRALLEKRLRGQGKGSQTEAIPVYDKAGPIPLSFGQERLWFLHQLDPLSPAYNMYNVVRLQGELNKAVLSRSFLALLSRHDILRTCFVVEGDRPYQKVSSEASFEIPEINLRALSPEEREIEVQEVIRTEVCRPFDLVNGPLIRALLIRKAEGDHILIVSMHHIIFDEWSNEVFWREFSGIYQALSAGGSPHLPELPVQYTDFTLWQKTQVERQMKDQLAYWKQQLAGDLPLIELPLDHPRPAQQTFRGGLEWRQLPDSLYGQLKALNQEMGTTMFMLLLSAFQVLLARYTNQSDILVGTPIANRSRPEIKGLIGLFLNTLVLRADLAEDLPFVEFAARTRKACLDAFLHQDLPFEILVNELRPARDKSHNPVFQVMFVHQKSAVEEIDLPGLQASPVHVDPGVSKFDLTLFAQESDGGLSVGLEYNSDLFDKGTADRLLGHFHKLLESIAGDPRRRISSLEFLPAEERRVILQDWNNTSTGPLPEVCIHRLIEDQAARRPDGIAVADQTRQLTYQELNQRANQLAYTLRELGVSADVPVGLLLERSTDMIVAILAVLKAGGAYLPLDPDYPRDRLEFMIRDARAAVLLTQERLAASIPIREAAVMCIDRDWEMIARQSTANPAVAAGPDNLAYIIYTSGSTGMPRGVPVSHRNLVHSTLARETFYEQPVGSFLLLSSFTFDSSVAGIFWTLCQGGKLVLPPQRIEQDMNQLAELIALHGITHTLCLPSLHLLLLELADPAGLSSLRAVIVAGEACQRELVRRHYDRLPGTGLYNEYGPTETTVWSTACRIPVDFSGEIVPIGRPIPNVQNYILDRYDQPVPVGVAGELCIAGAGVTHGYLNAPEKSAQKFVQISLGGEPPRFLYRTGDRARYLPDGNIEFLGRIDHQVKIRGNRVELGEIESTLRRLPGVREAVVVLREQQLVAYLLRDDRLPPSMDWHARLAETLPGYMIPAYFITLDEFPRTPNGKLDRKALPSPQSAGRTEQGFVAPRDETEQALAEIWRNVLGIDRVGVTDDFFQIGGNSILSIRVFAHIAREFDVNLPLSVLFTDTTIERLAARITEQKDVKKDWPVLVPIQPKGSRPPFFCVHGLGGGVLGYRDLTSALGDDQPVYGLQAYGQDGENGYDLTIPAMATRYITAMRAYQPQGPYRIGGYCFGGVVAYEMACQLEKMGEQRHPGGAFRKCHAGYLPPWNLPSAAHGRDLEDYPSLDP